MKKNLATFRDGLLSGRYNLSLLALFMVFAVALVPEVAYAQTGTDPFATAATAASTVRRTFTTFALAVGGIGMVSCLLLGFFGKLNWKWVATGVGVSFGLAIIPTAINYLSTLSGPANGG